MENKKSIEQIFSEIDEVANNPKYAKNWRITAKGKQNKDGEFEFVSHFPEIVKMVAKKYDVQNSAEILKNTKVKPFGRSNQKNWTKKDENGTYKTNAVGLSSSKTVSGEKEKELTESGKSVSKSGVFRERRISLNQFSFDGKYFDFGLAYLEDKDNPHREIFEEEAISQGDKNLRHELFLGEHETKEFREQEKREIVLKQTRQESLQRQQEQDLFEDFVERKREKMMGDSAGFSYWLSHSPKKDPDFQKELKALHEKQKNDVIKQGEEERQEKIQKRKRREKMVTSVTPKDLRLAEGMNQLFDEKDLDLKLLTPKPFSGLSQEECFMRKVETHEWMHTIAKHEKINGNNFMGGVLRTQEPYLHEGMTEWLARQVVLDNKHFFSTNDELEHNTPPQFWAYEPYVLFVDIIDNIFPGSVQDIYLNGTKAKEKYQAKGVAVQAIATDLDGKKVVLSEPFSVDFLIKVFAPLQEIGDLESKKDKLEDILKYQKTAVKIAKNLNEIKKKAREMNNLDLLSDDAFLKVQKNMNTLFSQFNPQYLFDEPVDFSKEDPKIVPTLFFKAEVQDKNWKESDFLEGKLPLSRCLGGSVYEEILKGNFSVNENMDIEVFGKVVPKEYKRFVDPFSKIVKLPYVYQDDQLSPIYFAQVLTKAKVGNQILDDQKIKFLKNGLEKDFKIVNMKCFALDDGTIVFSNDVSHLLQNGMNTNGVVELKLVENMKSQKSKFEITAFDCSCKNVLKAEKNLKQGKVLLTLPQTRAILNLARLYEVTDYDLSPKQEIVFNKDIEGEVVFDENGKVLKKQVLPNQNLKQNFLRKKITTVLAQKSKKALKQRPDELGSK